MKQHPIINIDSSSTANRTITVVDVDDDEKEKNENCSNVQHDLTWDRFNKSTRTNSTQTTWESNISTLTTPWAVIALVACIAGIYCTIFQNQDNDSNSDNVYGNYYEYFNTKSRVLVLGDEQQQQQQQPVFHDHPQHHKPVYNEDHKNLFPLNLSDYYGFGCAIIGLMIAAGGGIGGGGILVPIYILVMGFSPKHAIPLSNITVLGGALANTVLNIPKRHPIADRPLVDWDLILVMEPFTVAGALIGAILNKVLPEVLLSVLLVCLLSFTAWTSLKKAVKMFQKETRDIIAAQESELTKLEHQQDESNHEEAGSELLTNTDDNDDSDGTGKPKAVTVSTSRNDIDGHESLETLTKKRDLAKLLEEERTTNPNNLIVLAVMFAVVLTVNVLKGGGAFTSPIGITCGSKEFWFANIFLLVWIVAVAVFVRQYLVNRHHRKLACNYHYVDGDIKWDERTTIQYPVICMFAGFFAGMFGIGGGIVKGPLMLALGVHPAVSAASTAVMILFTAFVAATSFIVFGLLIFDYAIILSLIGFVSTLAGQVGLAYLMRKNQRNSYIVFSIGSVVALSAILMTAQSMISIAAGEKHHSGGICHTGD